MQILRNFHSERMRATKHAPRGPCRVLECRHGLAELVERGASVCDGGRNRPARNAIGAQGSVRMNETDGDLMVKHREASTKTTEKH